MPCALHYALSHVVHCVPYVVLAGVVRWFGCSFAHYALLSVRCMLHPVVHPMAHPDAQCVPCYVLPMQAQSCGATRCAFHIVLLVHSHVAPYPVFPMPLHPHLPDMLALPTLRALWEGVHGGVCFTMGAGLRAPLCKQGRKSYKMYA